MHRIAFLGPPGAGKGTQAARLALELGVPHLSTGEILRHAVSEGTALGKAADHFMREGRLVPDEIVLQLLDARLRLPDAAAGFVLDGYPRNLAQAEALARITPLDDVVFFELPEASLLERLTERWSCPTCGRLYNLVTLPPKAPGLCDQDGTPLLQRSDDCPEAVKTRLRTYTEQTTPLLAHYREGNLLRRLDAKGSIDEVARRLRSALEGDQSSSRPRGPRGRSAQ